MAFVSSHRSEEWKSEIILPGCPVRQCNVNCHMKFSISVPYGSKLSHHLFKYTLMVTRERGEMICVDIFTSIINNETSIQQRLDMPPPTCGTGRSGRYGLALVGQNVLSRYPFSAPPSPGNSTNVLVASRAKVNRDQGSLLAHVPEPPPPRAETAAAMPLNPW